MIIEYVRACEYAPNLRLQLRASSIEYIALCNIIHPSSSFVRRHRVIGLHNDDTLATCWFNAPLQLMRRLPLFSEPSAILRPVLRSSETASLFLVNFLRFHDSTEPAYTGSNYRSLLHSALRCFYARQRMVLGTPQAATVFLKYVCGALRSLNFMIQLHVIQRSETKDGK